MLILAPRNHKLKLKNIVLPLFNPNISLLYCDVSSRSNWDIVKPSITKIAFLFLLFQAYFTSFELKRSVIC